MKRISFLFVIFVFSFQLSYSQLIQNHYIHPFSGALVLSLDAGGTATVSDYNNFIADFQVRSSVDYYFSLNSKSALGLRVLGSIGNLSGSDPGLVPDKFVTSFSHLGGGVVYSYYFSQQFVPYIFGGLSQLWYKPKDVNDKQLPYAGGNIGNLNQLIYNAEIGFNSYLSKDLMFNANVGVNIGKQDLLDGLTISGTSNDYFFTASAGISYALFSKNNEDNDGDGVPDNEDQCPGTPPGVKVTTYGCPIDSDEDGVADLNDKCPNTSKNILVDKDGCPLDSDGDGVPDYLDKCAGTPEGTMVDQYGCKKNNEPDQQLKNKNIKTETVFHFYDSASETEIEKNIWTDGIQYVIQISSWSKEYKADRIAARLRAKGNNAFVQKAFVRKFNRTYYRVRIGYFNSLNEAESYLEKLK